VKRVLVVVPAALAFSIGLAQPAQAATNVELRPGGAGLLIGGVAVPDGTNINDTTIIFTNNSGSTVTFTSDRLQNGGNACSGGPSVCEVTSGGPALTLTASGPANAQIFQVPLGAPAVVLGRFTVNFGGGGGTPAASSTAGTPQPVLQQVEVPAGGCASVASPELNIGGVGPGGWGQSWAQWASEGAGGPVCTRTLVYSTVLGAWTTSS